MEDIISNFLDKFNCNVCKKLFDDIQTVPEIMQCGHTYCHNCITDFIATSKKCPDCDSTISNRTSVKNIFCLSLSSQLKDLHIFKNYSLDLAKIKKNLLTQKEAVSKSRFFYLQQFQMSDQTLTEINNLLEDNLPILKEPLSYNDYINNPVIRITKDIKVVPRFFSLLDDSNSFLRKVYNTIQSGQKLRTIHPPPNGEMGVRFGSISILGYEILGFHCLCLKEPEGCLDYVKFEDLKKVIASSETDAMYDFRLFLKFCTSENFEDFILIRVINSVLVPQFIHLCTGESGSSYKDAEYVYSCNTFNTDTETLNDRRLSLKSYNNFANNVDYAFTPKEYVTILKNKEYIVSDNHGSFQILRPFNDVRRYDCIGEIESPSELLKIIKSDGKIVDCGICFKLRQSFNFML